MTPKSDFVGMKKYNERKRRWDAVVCRIEVDEAGAEKVVVYDVEHAPTEASLDDWIERTIKTRPWEAH